MRKVSTQKGIDGIVRTKSHISNQFYKQLEGNFSPPSYNSPYSEIVKYYTKNHSVFSKNSDKLWVMNYLVDKRQYRNLIIASLSSMKAIIRAFKPHEHVLVKTTKDKYGNINKSLTTFGETIVKLLGYEKYRGNGKRVLELLNWLGIKSCPYCNSQYILTLDTRKTTGALHRKGLFQLDHYFPQSMYPYLATSFNNLIPSCTHCNQSKSARDTYITDTIHPYYDNYDDLCRFSGDPKSTILHLLKKNNPVNINLNIITKNKKELAKVKNHNNDFYIEALYQNHKDVVMELYWASLFYNSTNKSKLTSFMKSKGLSLTKNEINRFITGNYVNPEDILKRPLAKLTKDISEDLGLSRSPL